VSGNTLPELHDVERVQPGHIEVWPSHLDFEDAETLRQLRRAVAETIDEDVVRASRIWLPLRIVVVSGDMGPDLRQVKQGVGFTPNLFDADALGAALVWGDGSFAGTFAVVVVGDGVAQGLVDGSGEARATLAHELGHVHYRTRYLAELEAGRFPAPGLGNLIPCELAEVVFEEFACERIAWRHQDLGVALASAGQVRWAAEEAAERAAAAWEHHQRCPDLERLSRDAYIAMRGLAQTMGQALGAIHGYAEDASLWLAEMRHALGAEHHGVRDAIRPLYGELARQFSLRRRSRADAIRLHTLLHHVAVSLFELDMALVIIRAATARAA
jgi:hypothetical protein